MGLENPAPPARPVAPATPRASGSRPEVPGEGIEIGQSPVVVIDMEIERGELDHRQARPTGPEDIGMHGVAHIEGAIPCGAEAFGHQ